MVDFAALIVKTPAGDSEGETAGHAEVVLTTQDRDAWETNINAGTTVLTIAPMPSQRKRDAITIRCN
jgi:hypothetical protein